MHSVKEGPANQSYGLQVAQLAGVPRSVVQQARHKLLELESSSAAQTDEAAPDHQLGLFEPAADHPLLGALEALDPDSLTPREALQQLYRLKELL
jgi:DNA mismatch repair protein MutS